MRIETLRAILAEQLEKPVDAIHPATRLVEDLGIDSLAMKELLLSIDDACGVMPEAHHLRRIRTVADMHDVVTRLLAAVTASKT